MITGLLTMLAAGTAALVGSIGNVSRLLIGQTLQTGSIAQRTEAARVEPLTLIDGSLVTSDRLDPTLNVGIDIVASIYGTAMSLTNTTVGNTQIIKRLEALNPTSSSMRSLRTRLGLESYKRFESEDLQDESDGFIGRFIDDETGGVPDYTEVLAVESLRRPRSALAMEAKTDKPDDTEALLKKKRDVISSSDVREAVRDANALAFGKVINFELTTDGEKHQVPVTFRLATAFVDPANLQNAMSHRFQSEQTALERKIKWKTGTIESISDLFFCRDIVRSHAKNLMRDKDRVYEKLSPSNRGSYTRALLRGEVSVAQASNFLIISRDTADRVEAHLGGSFDNEGFRQRMLESTGIMVLAIIDPLHDTVTFYVESLARGQTVAGRNLEAKSKKNGPNLDEIMAVLTTGRGNLV